MALTADVIFTDERRRPVMIEHLNAKPGVIAVRATGHVAREGIDKGFEWLTEPRAAA
jgi:hypothetical protein